MGITVRVLDVTRLAPSRRNHIPHLVIFDDEVSYESTTAAGPDPATPRYFVSTRLSVNRGTVDDRRRLFADLWESGADLT